jgi:hypothetical protein
MNINGAEYSFILDRFASEKEEKQYGEHEFLFSLKILGS